MLNGINGPDPSPMIQRSHHTNDGGAGNLGYFQQEKKKKKDEDENDTIELSTKKDNDDEEEEKESAKKLDAAGKRIKTFWYKIHGLFSEAKEAAELNKDEIDDNF